MASFFQTLRPLKSERVKKILANEELRKKFLTAIKDLRDGRDAIFITKDSEKKEEQESIKLLHVKELTVDQNGTIQRFD